MTSETSLFIFIIVFVISMILLTIFVHKQDRKTIGDIHFFSSDEGEPPAWIFTLKKDLDINSIGDRRYVVFKVIKEE